MTTDTTTRVRVILEEELGEFRQFAGLPASDIEAMAVRLTRALAPVLEPRLVTQGRRDAA